MVKRIVSITALIVSLQLSAAIDVWVDPENVDETQTFILNIQSTDMKAGNIDESPLEADFEIISSRTNSHFRNINGKIQSWISWRYILRPKRTGRLTIPALKIGDQTTASLVIQVRPLSSELKNQLDEKVRLESVLSARTVYVQSQLILTRRLLYAAGFQQYGELPGPPELADAVVVYLGQRTPESIIRGGIRYQVFEQDYAIYPEKSGTLIIPAAAITGSVRLGPDRRRRGVRVQSQSISIKVLGIPDNYPPGAAWLPAEQVTLSDHWQPQSKLWDLGVPVTRTLTIKASASLGSIIPPIIIGVVNDHYKRYSEPVDIKDVTTPPAYGSREESYSYVAIQPGAQVIPAIELPWFDTLNEVVRFARLAEIPITITGSAVALPAPDQPTEPEPTISATQNNSTQTFSWKKVWIGVLLVLITCGGWLYAWGRQNAAATKTTTTEKPLKELKRRVNQEQPAATRRALAKWLAELWSCSEVEAIAKLAQDVDGARVLTALNRALYGPKNTLPPSKSDLTQLITKLKVASTKANNDHLPELYNY